MADTTQVAIWFWVFVISTLLLPGLALVVHKLRKTLWDGADSKWRQQYSESGYRANRDKFAKGEFKRFRIWERKTQRLRLVRDMLLGFGIMSVLALCVVLIVGFTLSSPSPKSTQYYKRAVVPHENLLNSVQQRKLQILHPGWEYELYDLAFRDLPPHERQSHDSILDSGTIYSSLHEQAYTVLDELASAEVCKPTVTDAYYAWIDAVYLALPRSYRLSWVLEESPLNVFTVRPARNSVWLLPWGRKAYVLEGSEHPARYLSEALLSRNVDKTHQVLETYLYQQDDRDEYIWRQHLKMGLWDAQRVLERDWCQLR